MATYLNRGMSMVTGNGYDSLVDANTRQLHNVNSPLQIFVKAKKNINDIFGDISDYVVETTTFIEGKNLSRFARALLTLFPSFQGSPRVKARAISWTRLKRRHFAGSSSRSTTFGRS